MTKIFIGGLNYQTTENTLLAHLSQFGHVASIRIITDKVSGKSKGFGFATFSNEEDAKKAIKELNGQIFEGRRIGVKDYIEKKA